MKCDQKDLILVNKLSLCINFWISQNTNLSDKWLAESESDFNDCHKTIYFDKNNKMWSNRLTLMNNWLTEWLTESESDWMTAIHGKH